MGRAVTVSEPAGGAFRHPRFPTFGLEGVGDAVSRRREILAQVADRGPAAPSALPYNSGQQVADRGPAAPSALPYNSGQKVADRGPAAPSALPYNSGQDVADRGPAAPSALPYNSGQNEI